MKGGARSLLWFFICSFVWDPSNKEYSKLKIQKQGNRTVKTEYKSSWQPIFFLSIHLDPYPITPPSYAFTPTSTDPYGRNTWDGVKPTTNMIPYHTQGQIILWIPLRCYRPCLQPIPEWTDSCYHKIVRSKISDRMATRLQPLSLQVTLQYYETWPDK